MDAVKKKTYLKFAIEGSNYVDGKEWFAGDITLEDLETMSLVAQSVLDDGGWLDDRERWAHERLNNLIDAVKTRRG